MHEPRDGRVGRRCGTVSRFPVSHEPDPVGRLLRDVDLHERAGRTRMDVVALREEILGAGDQVRPVIDQPAGAHLATGLLAGRREQDDVARKRHAASHQRDDGHRLHRGDTLRVERAAPVDEAVTPLAAERWDAPARGLGRHDVEMGEQHDRTRGARSRESRVEIAASGSRLDDLRVDADLRELAPKQLRGGRLVAGRVRGVDADQGGEQLRGLVSHRSPSISAAWTALFITRMSASACTTSMGSFTRAVTLL